MCPVDSSHIRRPLATLSAALMAICLAIPACSSEGASEGDATDLRDTLDTAGRSDTTTEGDARDPRDTLDTAGCSDTTTEAPVWGCPCDGQALGGLPGCCTRSSSGKAGWQCDNTWKHFQPTGCDGNPATCEQCPLCPEAWEPDP